MKKDFKNQPKQQQESIPPLSTAEKLKSLWPEILFFSGMLVLFMTALLGKIDPDIFVHLKQGELIVNETRFPTEDIYTYTSKGNRDSSHSWLTSAIFYLIFSGAGYFGIALFNSLVLLVTHIVLYYVFQLIGLSRRGCMILTSLSFLNFIVFVAPRSQNISFLLFAIALLCVVLWEKKNQNIAWVPIVMMPLWIQLHGGFILGLGVFGLLSIVMMIKDGKVNFQFVIPLVIGVSIGGIIHPAGFEAIYYPLQLGFTTPVIKEIISEFKPLDVSKPALFLPYFAIVFSLILFGLKTVPSRYPWMLLCFLFIYQSWTVQRMVPFFAMIGLITLGYQLKVDENTKIEKITSWILLLFSAVMIFDYFVPEYKNVFPYRNKDWDSAYPRQSVDIIKSYLPGKRIYNTYEWGGYLIFKLYPDNLVGIDPRGEPHVRFLTKFYHKIIEVTPKTNKILDKLEVDVVVFRTASRFAYFMYTQKDWARILKTHSESLFVRRKHLPLLPAQYQPDIVNKKFKKRDPYQGFSQEN